MHLKIDQDPRLQVVPGSARDRARAGRCRRRRAERLREVEHRGRGRVGGRLADALRAPRREARRRPLRRRARSEGRRALRGRARVRQRGRELAGARLQRGLDRAPARPRRRGAVPRQPDAVRRTDLVELLADVGLGSAMHSIVGQGKVEQVLASKPEDRRAFVEEAAGLGKFKRRRHRAELKLARVALQVERARDVEDEVRKRLRPLALQATAAERAEKLAVEIASLERASRGARPRRRRTTAAARSRFGATPRRSPGAAPSRGSKGCSPTARAPRTSSRTPPVAARRRSPRSTACRAGASASSSGASPPTTLRDRLGRELARARAVSAGETDGRRALEREALDSAAAARRAAAERDGLAEQARLASERLRSLERVLAEQEGLPPAARALAERGARLALGALEVEPGSERAVAAALRARASAVLADDPASGARAARAGPRRGARQPHGPRRGESRRSSSRSSRSCRKDELLAASVPSVTPEGFGYDPARRELWFAGETAEAVLLELEARRREVAARGGGARAAGGARRCEAPRRRPQGRSRRGGSSETFPSVRSRDPIDRDLLARIHECAARPRGGARDAARAAAARFDAPLRARVDAGALRSGELGDELRRLGAAEVGLRQELEEATERVDRRRGRARAPRRRDRRRRGAGSRLRRQSRREGDDRDELAARAERLETRRTALGQVNPLAREEYDVEKERLTDLQTQREDLERSLEELERLRADLAETVERRFAETFASVAQNFEEVAATLFPGGEGRLRLVEPDERGVRARSRGRAPSGRQADHAALAALRRREGARRDLVPLRALPRAAVRVLPPRRGRGRARRHQHRALRRAAPPLLRPRAVRRRHASEADDGGGGRPLRRHDGPGRRVAGRLAAAPAARARRRRAGSAADRSSSQPP